MPPSKKSRTKARAPGGKGGKRCPKCGGEMRNGTCTKCKYSSRNAYKSRKEAKEFTFAG